MTTDRPTRWYYGEIIWPKNVYGMFSAMVNQTPLAADTLDGIKSLIRETKGIKPRGTR